MRSRHYKIVAAIDHDFIATTTNSSPRTQPLGASGTCCSGDP
jgi:hypothetical protein